MNAAVGGVRHSQFQQGVFMKVGMKRKWGHTENYKQTMSTTLEVTHQDEVEARSVLLVSQEARSRSDNSTSPETQNDCLDEDEL